VVVEHDADDGVWRIVLVQALEQCDEIHAAVPFLDVGEDLSRVQVDSGQDRYGAAANILVVAPDSRRLARNWRQIRRSQPDGLNTGLLIDADGVDGVGPGVMSSTLAVDRDVPVAGAVDQDCHP
jgi:hypothetical protein